MDISALMTTMNKLHDQFRKEVDNVDPIHPDRKCDTTFLKRYIKAFDYYKIYMMLPEGHTYKHFYSARLTEILVEMGVEF